jgi:spore maturation protein CgeB/SAM-dependent methyltransferase
MNLDCINEKYLGDPTEPETERARQRIHWICSQATGQDVLDIGCSQGIVCLILGREGFRCAGLDLEAASLAVAQELLNKEDELVRRRVTFRVGDASQLPFEDASFDTVVLGEILEHLTHPARVLAEAKRVLREGGRLIITVPYGLNSHHDHKRTYYPASLLDLVKPLCKTRSISTLNNYITYTGERDRSYDPAGLSDASQLEEYRRLEKVLEAHCLSKEQALLELGTRLYAQLKTLNSQVIVQGGRIKELEETVAEKDKLIRDLESGLKEARTSITALREGTAKLEAEQMRLRTTVASTSAALAAAQQERVALQEQDSELRQKLLAREEALLRLSADLAKSSAELTAAQQQLVKLQAENIDFRQKLHSREEELGRLRAGAGKSNATTSSIQQQLLALQTENAALRQELTAAEAARRKQLADREAILAARLREREVHLQALALQTENDRKRKMANQRVRDVARVSLPADARVLVISKGDDDLLPLDGRHGWHFPQTAGGVYAGYHPADSTQAIAHLETLRARGAEFLLIPATSFWWLDYYADFRLYLESQYRLLTYCQGTCVIYALDAPPPEINDRLTFSSDGALAKTSAMPDLLKPADRQTPAPPVKPAQPISQSPATPPQLKLADKQTAPPNGQSRVAPGQPNAAKKQLAPSPVKTAQPVGKRPETKVMLGSSDTSPTPTASVVPQTSLNATTNGLTIGGVLDEFTTACLRPECSLVTFRPDNWSNVLDGNPVSMLIVESAWRANEGSWQYKIASFSRSMGEELVDLVSYCKQRNIPTVFWNKEDPAHFDRFIQRAFLFDLVFTTDADCIPRYRERVGHDRVFAFPFAAQPAIHHPILGEGRDRAVCFAGTYYGDRHQERQVDMDFILRPAVPFGLEIYDRQHGMTGKAAETYRFPDIYQPCIKGRLDYDQMVKAYKRYRVFLNVNSVKHSPTMFSRRVFELLACGTPVISTYSRGIVELLGDDIVFLTESESDTRRHLDRLLGNEDEWARASVRGIRKVMDEHTYRNRLRDVLGRAGIALPQVQTPRISVVVRLASNTDLERAAFLLSAQTHRQFDLVLVSEAPLPDAAVTALRNALPDIVVTSLAGHPVESFAGCQRASSAEYFAFLHLRDSYGPNYLKDLSLAAMYSGADFLGKHTYYADRARGGRELRQPGHEFQYVTSIASATLVAKKAALSRSLFEQALDNRLVRLQSERILSIDRFNYCRSMETKAGQQIRRAAKIQCEEVYA